MSVLLPHSIISNNINCAIEKLSAGQVVAIPTETVYGLAGLGYNASAIAEIYRLKMRPMHNPLIMHYACLEDTIGDVMWTPWARRLAHHFWPGPITFVLSLTSDTRIPLMATGGLNSAAIRVPSHPMVREILKNLSGPLAAPSANLSGQLSPTTAEHVANALPVFVLDGGACPYGVESTIIDGRSWPAKILRSGALPVEEIESILLEFADLKDHQDKGPPIFSNRSIGGDCLDHMVCPGQLTSHYAPKKPLRLQATNVYPNEGLLAFGPPLVGAKYCVQLSLEKNLIQAAANLFSGLHHLDQSDCDSIAVMPIPTEGIGCAIADRLSRACATSTWVQTYALDSNQCPQKILAGPYGSENQ
jgi:L-threonylcarbamoyladenylate synthase